MDIKKTILLFALMVPLLLAAQPAPQTQPSSLSKKKVLLLPFHQKFFYFSNSDKSIAAESKLRVREVRLKFRKGLDRASRTEFRKYFQPINPLLSTGKESSLQSFYESVSYSYKVPTRLKAKKDENLWDKLKSKMKTLGQREVEVLNEKEEEYFTKVEAIEDKYMALTWKDSSFFQTLVDEYQPGYIVTINQFEIRTDYRKCIDRELGNLTRSIRVHYNVFDNQGNCLFGDVATVKYNSTTEDIDKIINDNFGVLTEYIQESIPVE